MTKLVPLPLGDPNGITVSSTSLQVIDPNLTLEGLGEILDNTLSMGDAVRWWTGDILLYAESRWGEESAQLLDGHRLSERQATKYRWVAEKIVPSLRRENLSFSHHELVAALPAPDQQRLLALADAGEMAVAAFREIVRDHKAFENPTPDPPRQVIVMGQPTATVDAARGLRTARETLHTVGSTSPEVAENLHIHDAVRGIDQAAKVVRRAELLEEVLAAAQAVRWSGVTQTHLPDPAIIVPSGPWDTLSDAIDRATEGRTR